MDIEDKVAAGIGCLGCFIWLVYVVVYIAVSTFVVWTLLAAIGIINRFPWQ